LPFGFEETALWQSSLAVQSNDSHAAPRTHLSEAFLKVRERAQLLAAEVARDLPDFTVHDISHLDALWDLAATIAGPEISLSPTEAFVLGSAFLVHDLGMGVAAIPGGTAGLEADSRWNDVLATVIGDRLRRPVSEGDVSSATDVDRRIAREWVLRELHAERGESLALASWNHANGEVYHLIEDVELRTQFGPLIGEIAASHGWDLAEVADRFRSYSIGAPVNCPGAWTVDPLKLACLIRLADAAHLDASRAPGFLRAIRAPQGYSDLHWQFQGHLQRAQRDFDRLVFTSARPFPIEEASAWWLCFETLQMVDHELATVDALLADRSRPRFAARSVKGVADPTRLTDLVPTSGWIPVDARVKVTNVPSLVRRLGGEKLYGDRPRVGLRELIQNARDASRAKATILGEEPSPIRVSLQIDEHDATWLTVADTGIGMSQAVLTGPLLDFGTSYWGSDLMRRELVGLASSRFEPVGRFGVGFYATFMLGEEVRVVSRRFDAASADTRVLDFPDGVATRPIVRFASGDDLRHAGGTAVSVRLRSGPTDEAGLLCMQRDRMVSLAELCAFLAPALDVNLEVSEFGSPFETVVEADDWKSIDAAVLLRRLGPYEDDLYSYVSATLDALASRVRNVESSGVVVGRLSLSPTPPAVRDGEHNIPVRAFAVIGGLNSEQTIGGVAGIAVAKAATADRQHATLAIPSDALQQWGTQQADEWWEYVNEELEEGGYTEVDDLASVICLVGGDTGQLAIARDETRLYTASELKSWAASRQSVTFIESFSLDIRDMGGRVELWHQEEHVRMTLHPDVLLAFASGAQYGERGILGNPYPDQSYRPTSNVPVHQRSSRDWYYFNQRSVGGHLVRVCAEAWDLTIDDMLERISGTDRYWIPNVGNEFENEANMLQGSPVWTASRDIPPTPQP
jgi:hypothetical protein